MRIEGRYDSVRAVLREARIDFLKLVPEPKCDTQQDVEAKTPPKTRQQPMRLIALELENFRKYAHAAIAFESA